MRTGIFLVIEETQTRRWTFSPPTAPLGTTVNRLTLCVRVFCVDDRKRTAADVLEMVAVGVQMGGRGM